MMFRTLEGGMLLYPWQGNDVASSSRKNRRIKVDGLLSFEGGISTQEDPGYKVRGE
jgi:hypothetical protein